MHDSTLNRTTNGIGEVHKHTFDEIRALDAGAKFSPSFAGTTVPTLDEAFDLAHGKINVYVDTKYVDPLSSWSIRSCVTTCRTTS
jgi:glycerophosphoryl diester phosphodiesterase